MSQWSPIKQWVGADVAIVGGGPSLRGFDWRALHPFKVIGCNAAFLLTAAACHVGFFADRPWFDAYQERIEAFAGPVVTNCEEGFTNHPWVHYMERRDIGLHTEALGFGGNSGCSAINLALVMGAKRVLLLGFDCKLGAQQEMNWHDMRMEPAQPGVFPKFQEGFHAIARDLPRVFPGCEVINCTPDSALTCFPVGKLEDFA